MPAQQELISKPRILHFDLETAPSQAWIWGLWKENIGTSQVIEPGRIICWAAKFDGEKEIYYSTEWDDGHEPMIQQLYSLVNEADVLVAHFGSRFDKPTMNMEFLKYGLAPPTPNKMIDTYQVARSTFKLLSNKLDFLGEFFGLGRKIKTDFDLWADTLAGDPKAQAKMLRYNIQDVKLLEKVYHKLRPWIRNHPNLSLYLEKRCCPNCGSGKLHRRGYAYTGVSKFQRFRCMDCGAWSRTRFTEISADVRKEILTQDKTK